MATNATTWFFQEPEHRAYFIEERVNHTFWSNRITNIYLDCISEEPPFRMVGTWQDAPVELEWVPNDYLRFAVERELDANRLLTGLKEILGFPPTVSFVDRNGTLQVEWHVGQSDERIREIQASTHYRDIKRYKA